MSGWLGVDGNTQPASSMIWKENDWNLEIARGYLRVAPLRSTK
jgi:hypothetical protein